MIDSIDIVIATLISALAVSAFARTKRTKALREQKVYQHVYQRVFEQLNERSHPTNIDGTNQSDTDDKLQRTSENEQKAIDSNIQESKNLPNSKEIVQKISKNKARSFNENSKEEGNDIHGLSVRSGAHQELNQKTNLEGIKGLGKQTQFVMIMKRSMREIHSIFAFIELFLTKRVYKRLEINILDRQIYCSNDNYDLQENSHILQMVYSFLVSLFFSAIIKQLISSQGVFTESIITSIITVLLSCLMMHTDRIKQQKGAKDIKDFQLEGNEFAFILQEIQKDLTIINDEKNNNQSSQQQEVDLSKQQKFDNMDIQEEGTIQQPNNHQNKNLKVNENIDKPLENQEQQEVIQSLVIDNINKKINSHKNHSLFQSCWFALSLAIGAGCIYVCFRSTQIITLIWIISVSFDILLLRPFIVLITGFTRFVLCQVSEKYQILILLPVQQELDEISSLVFSDNNVNNANDLAQNQNPDKKNQQLPAHENAITVSPSKNKSKVATALELIKQSIKKIASPQKKKNQISPEKNQQELQNINVQNTISLKTMEYNDTQTIQDFSMRKINEYEMAKQRFNNQTNHTIDIENISSNQNNKLLTQNSLSHHPQDMSGRRKNQNSYLNVNNSKHGLSFDESADTQFIDSINLHQDSIMNTRQRKKSSGQIAPIANSSHSSFCNEGDMLSGRESCGNNNKKNSGKSSRRRKDFKISLDAESREYHSQNRVVLEGGQNSNYDDSYVERSIDNKDNSIIQTSSETPNHLQFGQFSINDQFTNLDGKEIPRANNQNRRAASALTKDEKQLALMKQTIDSNGLVVNSYKRKIQQEYDNDKLESIQIGSAQFYQPNRPATSAAITSHSANLGPHINNHKNNNSNTSKGQQDNQPFANKLRYPENRENILPSQDNPLNMNNNNQKQQKNRQVISLSELKNVKQFQFVQKQSQPNLSQSSQEQTQQQQHSSSHQSEQQDSEQSQFNQSKQKKEQELQSCFEKAFDHQTHILAEAESPDRKIDHKAWNQQNIPSPDQNFNQNPQKEASKNNFLKLEKVQSSPKHTNEQGRENNIPNQIRVSNSSNDSKNQIKSKNANISNKENDLQCKLRGVILGVGNSEKNRNSQEKNNISKQALQSVQVNQAQAAAHLSNYFNHNSNNASIVEQPHQKIVKKPPLSSNYSSANTQRTNKNQNESLQSHHEEFTLNKQEKEQGSIINIDDSDKQIEDFDFEEHFGKQSSSREQQL